MKYETNLFCDTNDSFCHVVFVVETKKKICVLWCYLRQESPSLLRFTLLFEYLLALEGLPEVIQFEWWTIAC